MLHVQVLGFFFEKRAMSNELERKCHAVNLLECGETSV